MPPGKLIESKEKRHRSTGRAVAPFVACLWLPFLSAAPPAAGQAGAVCPEGRISSVFIDNHSVFDLSAPDLNERLAWAYRTANRLHSRTDESVIRRELLFGEGDCYDLDLLRDSERLLRSLEFIAHVDLYGLRQPDGTVHVIVDTQDEWSTRVQPRVRGSGLTGLRVREDNIFGSGQQVGAFYLDDREQQVFGISYRTPQLLGTRSDAALEVGRTPVGYLLAESIRYPFVGEVGRWAVTQAVLRHDRYFEYIAPGPDGPVAAWYPERRQSAELGAAYRWGRQGNDRTMVGLALAGEWVAYPSDPRYGDDDLAGAGAVPPPLEKDSVSTVRAVFMTGQRNVYYVRRRALDTVNGTEDVRLGVEAGITIAPSLPGISADRDLGVDLGLFTATELLPTVLTGVTMALQARRSYDAPAAESEWSDVFGRFDGWAYWRPGPDSRQTLVLTLSAAGGWHDRVPFQLTMGERTGLRGYADHAYAGGRRVIATAEQRALLAWPLPDLFDLAGVAFADVGRIWAGDASFGEDSPLRAGVGLGLRLAFPPGSRQTLRLDVGVPLTGGAAFRDMQISIGMGQVVGRRISDPGSQLARSSRLGPSALLFAPEQR
jgi:hypothetical protein